MICSRQPIYGGKDRGLGIREGGGFRSGYFKFGSGQVGDWAGRVCRSVNSGHHMLEDGWGPALEGDKRGGAELQDTQVRGLLAIGHMNITFI